MHVIRISSKSDGAHKFWSIIDLVCSVPAHVCFSDADDPDSADVRHAVQSPAETPPADTDCSGLASLVSNLATDRPAFGGRFNTGNEESALLARGFKYGTAPGALVIGWNGGHTAVTLPDGTPVSSGEGGGVRIGGGGAYQPQFSHHMYLPVDGSSRG